MLHEQPTAYDLHYSIAILLSKLLKYMEKEPLVFSLFFPQYLRKYSVQQPSTDAVESLLSMLIDQKFTMHT